MLLLAALQLNILKRAKNHHFPNTEINNRVGDGTIFEKYTSKHTFTIPGNLPPLWYFHGKSNSKPVPYLRYIDDVVCV